VRAKEKHKIHFIDKLAVANGVLSGITLYPQVLKVFLNTDIAGLSITALFLLLTNSIIWCVYAVHRNLFSLLVSSILNSVASFLLLIATLFFR